MGNWGLRVDLKILNPGYNRIRRRIQFCKEISNCVLLDEYDCIMLERKTFVETCGKERGAISVGRGADLLVGLAHFPLLLPEQVPVLLQRLLLFHHHHCDPFTWLHKPAEVPIHRFCFQHKDSCPVEKA